MIQAGAMSTWRRSFGPFSGRFLRNSRSQQTTCAVAADRESLRVGSDFGCAIGDLCEDRPRIIVCSGVRILWSKTINRRNNHASDAIRYAAKECIGTFEIPATNPPPW
jgi:hypothetical protein